MMIWPRFFSLLLVLTLLLICATAVPDSISEVTCNDDDGVCTETITATPHKQRSVLSVMEEDLDDVYTVAVCTSTGRQGREVVKRLKEITPHTANRFHVIGLTRKHIVHGNSSSSSSDGAAEQLPSMDFADEYVQTNYTTESLKDIFTTHDINALFLNYVAVKDQTKIEAGIIDAAVQTNVKHIIYSSIVGCDTNTGIGHYESSYNTELYLKKVEQQRNDLTVHFVRLGPHYNENILQQGSSSSSYNFGVPNFKKKKIQYPWDSHVPFPTSSLRDVGRVVGKLFVDPSLGPQSIDAVTEVTTANDIAHALTLATNTTIRATKGPWVLLKFGKLFGWQAKSILQMSKYIDGGLDGYNVNLNDMKYFLMDELKDEPLESIEKFALRHYGDAKV